MRKTKIVCTIGPSTRSQAMIRSLIRAGMDAARLNFSHGTHDEHREVIQQVRSLSQREGRPIGIIQDLAGPKIRLGTIDPEPMLLREGQELLLTADDVQQGSDAVQVGYPSLLEDVEPGARILIDDGTIRLRVVAKEEQRLRCKVLFGGQLGSHKGVNLPDSKLHLAALTEKDRDDLGFGISQQVDWVALSFVRTPDNIREAKTFIQVHGSDIPVIAKIEKQEALAHLDEIIAEADAVMVARGDLGVEADLEDVPLIQKRIVKHCKQKGKPVIIATQMLDSMQSRPYPTRAEVSDVANAILDGADAVMLSQETAVGAFPVESVAMTVRIAQKAEASLDYGALLLEQTPARGSSVADAVSHACCEAAHDLDATAIITCTMSGSTARKVARYRPRPRIIAVSPNSKTVTRLCLSWGVEPIRIGSVQDTDDMTDQSVRAALQNKWVRPGDRVVITAGVPIEVPGTTNLMRVHDVPSA